MALTAKIINGSIKLPEGVMRSASLQEGSEVAFRIEGSRIVIQDAVLAAYNELENIFLGAAEQAGLKNEEDVVSYCKEVRRELMAEKLGRQPRVSND